MLPLVMTDASANSRMFRGLPADVFDYITKFNTTTNDHTEGINPATYVNPQYPALQDFSLLSYNYDAVGRIFASTIEHKQYPIYAVQWHPEVTQFFRLPGFEHGPRAIRVSQYMAIWLAEQLRKTHHSFASIEDASQATMINYLVRVNATTLNAYYLFPK
jgi:gamma-glutamyl hydrolase